MKNVAKAPSIAATTPSIMMTPMLIALASGWSAPHVTVTRASGVAAGAEIVAWLSAQSLAAPTIA